MDMTIGSVLVFDGVIKGSIYALLALATVLAIKRTKPALLRSCKVPSTLLIVTQARAAWVVVRV